MTLVLLASSDQKLRADLAALLRRDGYVTQEAADGLKAFRAVFSSQPDAIVVDLGIEEVDGLELVRMLRAASDLAILVLLPTGDQAKGVPALEFGADDVVRSHTLPTEVLARLKASLRRSQRYQSGAGEVQSIVRTGRLVIDRQSQEVTNDGRRVRLSRTEYKLLDALASRLGQVAPHRFLLSSVWGGEYVDDTHYLRVYVGYLRAKLEENPRRPRYILNERGVGYRLAHLALEEDAREPRRAPKSRTEEVPVLRPLRPDDKF